jgi:hypothetical protein
MQAALKLAGGEKWCGIKRLSTGWGSRMSQSLILIGALSSACWEKKEKKGERNGQGAFFSGQDTSCWLFCVRFSWLLGAIQG